MTTTDTVTEKLAIDPADVPGVVEKLQQEHNSLATKTDKSVSTVSNAAGVTLSAAQVIGGVIIRAGATGAVSDATPTAALLAAAVPHVAVNDVVRVEIRNDNGGTLTITAGSGVTLSGSMTIEPGQSREFNLQFTNVTAASEAVTITNFGVNEAAFSQRVYKNTLDNASGQTLTAAQMLKGLLVRSGAAAISDTTPTAAALVAAVPHAYVGQTFMWTVRNDNSDTLTLVAGSGVTLEGTTTIATTKTRVYSITFTNVTAASEAVTVSGIMLGA